MDPSLRVCPRCGSPAHEHEYCQSCGLHLYAQPELPTLTEWEQGVRKWASTGSATSTQKSAGVSGVLSFVVPGLGHVYAGAWGRGLVFLTSALVVGWAAALITGAVGLFAGVVVSLVAALDAFTKTRDSYAIRPPRWEENRAQLPLAGFLGAVALALMIGSIASGTFSGTENTTTDGDGTVDCFTGEFGGTYCE